MAKKKTTKTSGNKTSGLKTDSKKTDSKRTENFEESLECLESLVRELESGRLGLSGSLQKYEQGIGYLKHCHSLLESAEQRVSLLTGIDREGNERTRPFDDAATKFQDFSDEDTDEDDLRDVVSMTVVEDDLESQIDDHFGDEDEEDDKVQEGSDSPRLF